MISENNLAHWEHFSHGADIGIRGYGPTLESAFEMGAMALTGVMLDPKILNAEVTIEIQCTAPDYEILFNDWINAIIYQTELHHMLFNEFHVNINNLKLTATIRGEKIDRSKHQPAVDVKGATFTELKVYYQDHLWIAQCVVDV